MSFQLDIREGRIPCRGVNLGGWLVAEHWITWDAPLWKDIPSEIIGKGEFALMQHLGHEEGDLRFHNHRSTWITVDDIKEIKQRGLNTVRVPVGFWIIGYDPADDTNSKQCEAFAPNSLCFLDLLINDWCLRYKIAVIVDIHAAKGSQNGMEHSTPREYGKCCWSESPENVKNTLHVSQMLCSRYRFSPAFLGLGLLNAPTHPLDPTKAKDYYRRAYHAIRSSGNDCILTVSSVLLEQRQAHFHDIVDPLDSKDDYFNVWVDWHPYYAWGFNKCVESEITAAVEECEKIVRRWKGNQLIFGEWSLGAPQCIGIDREKLQRFAEAQIKAFNNRRNSAGWIFWTWKHSSDAQVDLCPWSMRQLLREEILHVPA